MQIGSLFLFWVYPDSFLECPTIMQTVSDADLERYERFSHHYERLTEKMKVLGPKLGLVLLWVCIAFFTCLGWRKMGLTAIPSAIVVGSITTIPLILFIRACGKWVGWLLRWLTPSVRRVDHVRHEQHEEQIRRYEIQHEEQMQRLNKQR